MAKFREVGILELFPAKAQTATLNGTGVDLQDYIETRGHEMAAYLNVGAKSGTSPTLDITIEESDSSGSGYSAISGAAFTQASDVTSETIYFKTTKRYVRAVATLGGTSPSFTMAVSLLATKRLV